MKKVHKFLAVTLVTVMLSGCAWFKANGGKVVTGVGDAAACVILHESIDPDPTFEGIVEECADTVIDDVEKIAAAQMSSPTPGASVKLHHKLVAK